MRPSRLTLGGPALRAFLVALLGAVATLGLIAVPYLVLEGERSLLERASTWGFFVAFFAGGTPVAYAVTGAVVWPGYAVLRRL